MLIRQGNQSNDTAFVQRALNLSTRFTPKLAVDGIFGPRTAERVKQFQGARRLAPDGVVGPATLGALFRGANRGDVPPLPQGIRSAPNQEANLSYPSS
jgi:peptidoglycan hydrolase-like protein with peptidoglycan-binding domain